MNDTRKTTIAIYSMRLAVVAMSKGFVLLSMERNTDNSGRNVFYFNDTPELKRLMADYKVSRKG